MTPARDRRWWSGTPKDSIHEIVVPLVRKLRQNQALRKRMDLLHATLYADKPITGLGPFNYAKIGDEDVGARLNVCKAVSDSWVAMITRNTPKPMAITEGGDWIAKRKGKGCNKWLDAIFDEAEIRTDLAPQCGRHAAVFGTSLIKVYPDVPGTDSKAWKEAKAGFALTMPWDITTDDAEAQDPRNLRQMYETKWYDRAVLSEMFPASKDDIARASMSRGDRDIEGFDGTSGAHDLIEVHEGYHLRSSRLSTDGYRCVCIEGATLAFEPWKLDRFPYAVLRRAKAPMGFYGIGIPEELRGIQTSINDIALAYEEAMLFFARPKWVVPRSARVQKAHLDDQIGAIVEFDGPIPPVMQVAQMVMPGDVTAYLWALWQKGHDQIGVSQMFANGSIPAGLKSGEAIRRYNDTSNARFGESLKLYEHFHVDLASLAIEVGRQIAEHNPKFASAYVGKHEREIVYFKDIDPGQDKYTLKVHAASALASTPSEKFEQLDELYQRKLIDDATFRVLLDWPDLESESSLVNAPYEVAEKLITRFLEAEDPGAQGVYIAPDPDWNLTYIRARFQYAAALAFLDDAPEENVRLLRKFADQCIFEMDKAKPANIVAPAGGPPMAPPGAPPQGMPPGPQGAPQMPPGGAPPMPQAA